LTVAQVLAVRRLAHALLAARHDDLAVARRDLLRCKRHGPEARTAKLVHAPRRCINRNTGCNRCLTRRVLTSAGGENLAHDDFVDVADIEVRPLDRRGNGNLAEFVGRQGRQPAGETSRQGYAPHR
jgi:hypothetical protein